jgi:tripartite-type tricarboxylate transporter receptor subunit TctC
MNTRLIGRAGSACLAALCLAVAPAAQAWPDAPVKLMVGFVPGGPTDLYGRIAARVLSDAFGREVVVENRPGGSGAIAAKMVAGAPADGHTLLVNVSADVITPIINKKAGYDLQTNFTPIGLIVSAPNVLVTGPGTPAESVPALIALAKKTPGSLTYASAGTATVSHLAGALFAAETGTTLTHVPYKGTAGAQVDLLAGRVSLMFDNLTNGLANAKAGKVKALAITSPKRWPNAPELPTMAEAGYPGVTLLSTFGLMAPAGTPAPVIQRIAVALQKGLADEKMKKTILDSGSEPGSLGPKEFGAVLA